MTDGEVLQKVRLILSGRTHYLDQDEHIDETLLRLLDAERAKVAVLEAALRGLTEFAWTAVTADYEEARVYLNSLVAAGREALAAPAAPREPTACVYCGERVTQFGGNWSVPEGLLHGKCKEAYDAAPREEGT